MAPTGPTLLPPPDAGSAAPPPPDVPTLPAPPTLPTPPTSPAAPTTVPAEVARADEAPAPPRWKQRRRSARVIKRGVQVALVVALALAAWYAWGWWHGDTFGAHPADQPNALEARTMSFTIADPSSGGSISVRSDLVSREGLGTANGVTIARRSDGVFVSDSAASWRRPDEADLIDHGELLAAIDTAMVLTIDDVVSRAKWSGLRVADVRPVDVTGPKFVAREPFDVDSLGSSTFSHDPDVAFPIPRISRNDNPSGSATSVAAHEVTVEVDRGDLGAPVIDWIGQADGDDRLRLAIVVDDIGAVHSIELGGDPLYALHDAAVERVSPFADSEPLPDAGPPPPGVDLDAASREAIGPRRFDRIVERTGVTLTWGGSGGYDGRATWFDDGTTVTMQIVITEFKPGLRDELLAHEIAHIAAFSVGIHGGGHECLADIVASHWIGHQVTQGSYDYWHCARHGKSRQVLDAYG